jgi:hypothetical protein
LFTEGQAEVNQGDVVEPAVSRTRGYAADIKAAWPANILFGLPKNLGNPNQRLIPFKSHSPQE